MLENWFQAIVLTHSSRCCKNPRSSHVDWKFNIQPLTRTGDITCIGPKEIVGMLGEGIIIQKRQKVSAGDHNHTEKIGKKTSWMNGRLSPHILTIVVSKLWNEGWLGPFYFVCFRLHYLHVTGNIIKSTKRPNAKIIASKSKYAQ